LKLPVVLHDVCSLQTLAFENLPRLVTGFRQLICKIISALLICKFMRENWHIRTIPEQLEFHNVNKTQKVNSYLKRAKALYGL